MISILLILGLKLLCLSLAVAAIRWAAICGTIGFASAFPALPGMLLKAARDTALLPVRIVWSFIGGVITGMKQVVLAVFDAVIGVLWSVVPGISSIPRPSVSKLI